MVWLFGFLTFSSATRLYRRRAPRQSVWQLYVLTHTRQREETLTSISAGHIILTRTQPVGSGRPQRESKANTSSPGVALSAYWATARPSSRRTSYMSLLTAVVNKCGVFSSAGICYLLFDSVVTLLASHHWGDQFGQTIVNRWATLFHGSIFI